MNAKLTMAGLLVACLTQAGVSCAQEELRVITPVAAHETIPATSGIEVIPMGEPGFSQGGRRGFDGERPQRVRTLIHDQGYCCGVDPGFPGCTNFRETLRFIFGSCRSFFGEPCLPKGPRQLFDRSCGVAGHR